MNAWARQQTHPSGGYCSPYHHVWADIKAKDATPQFQKDRCHKRDLWGFRVRRLDAELKARRDIQRRTASDPDAAQWWKLLTPAEANQVIVDLASGKIRLT